MHTTIRTALCAAASILVIVGGAASADPPGTPSPAVADAPADSFTLRLAEYTFDPLDALPELPAGWDRVASAGPDLHLVQLDGPTRAASIESIKARGLEIVQYVYPYTYIVWGSDSQIRGLSSVPSMRASAEFAPAFRVQPQWRTLGSERQDVRVLMYRGANTDAVVRAIERLGGLSAGRRALNATFEIAGFDLPGDRMRAVANLPGVYSVRLRPTEGGLRSEMSDQVCVNNVDASNIAFPGYPAWLAGVGLDGNGVIIANVDSGIDDTHPDLVNRMIPCTGDTCGGSTSSSHGTHTGGIMAGDGSSGVLDAFGFLRGQGMAPGSNLVEQVYSPWHTQPGGMFKLMNESFLNGASLSGNSWGPSDLPQGYDDDTLEVDLGARDADPNAPGNQPLLYVLSIMNGYGGTSSQGTPDEAKNIFTIGSTKMRTSGGAQDPDIDDLSANSAHGPCLDGRTIPHMVAPGCEVDSSVPGGHGLKCGTSMASPHVSGAAGLFIEYYRGLVDYVEDPSPAMVKAAFLAVGRDLAGNEDADGNIMGHPFDNKQGWGRMDVEAVVDPPANSVRYFDDPVLLNNTGEEWVSSVSPLDVAQPMRIMLVWTDAPGHGLGGSTPAWNNDLDLVVDVGGDVYRGNNFGADGYSVPGGSADFQNNTEGVFLESVSGGGVTIHVVASNINSDGVPSVGDDTDQDFALACYNCAVEPGFTLAADPTSQEVCAPDDASYSIEVGEILGFSDPVTLSVRGVPAGASASFTVNPVTPPGTSVLEITDTGSAAAGEYTLTIEGVSGGISRSVAVDLRIDSAVPAQVTLGSPADGAVDVPVTPTLAWMTVPHAIAYEIEVARDAALADIVYSATVSSTTHVVQTPLDSLTTHYWRVRAHNGCGDGGYSATFSFTTFDYPPVLLVDDDDNGPDVRDTYTDALDALGVAYDLWDTGNSDVEPEFTDLAPYEAVIWFTGDEYGGAAGPGSGGESALASWLDIGNCLLVASQDYHYDRGLTSFMQTYLGVASVVNDQSQTTVTGQGTIFQDLGPYTLSFPYTNYTDVMTPDAAAEVAFVGDQGNAAVSNATGIYLTTFWSFGLETLPTEPDRHEVLSAFFLTCDAMPVPDSDQDGAPNDVDCAPMDADNWSMPGAAEDFTVKKILLSNLSWSPPDQPGGTSVTYDVLRNDSPSDFTTASCLTSDTSLNVMSDPTDPSPGAGYYYLIRVRNGCGDTLGVDSAGEPRPPGASCN
jgi:hypothetical protein